MIEFKKLKLSTKILIPAILMIFVSNVITTYISSNKMEEMAFKNTRDSLSMLTDSIFITLRNAMNSGNIETIKEAEKNSRENIKGLESLVVAKSKNTIELFSPNEKYTSDKNILEVFDTKKELVIQMKDENGDSLRVLRPMIAQNDCLMCHVNEKEGNIIGVIDLKFSLDEANQLINSSIKSLIVASFFVIFIISMVILYITKRATYPILDFQKGLIEFFRYLSKENDKIEPLVVHSMDEIGQMVVAVNENIKKTIDGINQDEDAIKQSALICQKASSGELNVKINATASNPEINHLINIVNDLLLAMSQNVRRVLRVLHGYTHDNYEQRINSQDDTKAEIRQLFDSVDVLGETLKRLSEQNLKNGLALQQNGTILSQNVEKLTNSSKQQAVSLQETKLLIDDIVTLIKNGANNTNQMSNLSNEVLVSLNNGHKLANETTKSMVEINDKINLINDSISIIDQIAFQTNILSLNAAVEAATAGESGKGFAVVAGEVRNLASRSAEAAKSIKDLVFSATTTANSGKDMATTMIEGYELLNSNISSTITIINQVANDTKVQLSKIHIIDESITVIDKETNQNAQIAIQTNIISQQANEIATKIVEDAKSKEFDGKNEIKIREKIIDPNYKGTERRNIENKIKAGELDRADF